MGLLDRVLRYSIRRYFYKRAFVKMREMDLVGKKILPKNSTRPIKQEKVDSNAALEKEMFDQLNKGVGRKK